MKIIHKDIKLQNTTQNYIYINIQNTCLQNGIFGGNNIIINKINFQEKGYENSNYFEINLFKFFIMCHL